MGVQRGEEEERVSTIVFHSNYLIFLMPAYIRVLFGKKMKSASERE